MYRGLVALLAVLAALLSTQSIAASEHKPINPTIDATANVVGAGWTVGLFAINHWRWKWNAESAGISSVGAIVGTTIGCMAASPIVATVVLNRPLSYREAHILMGSCLIPFIGGWLVNEAYNQGWLWAPDEKPVRLAHHQKKKMAAKPVEKTAAR